MTTSIADPDQDHQVEWGEPLPLQAAEIDGEPYPLKALGSILSSAAQAIADSAQAPDGLAAHGVLAAASLAVQGLFDVEVDGRRYPTSLDLMAVALSGDRKSAVDRLALKPVAEFERGLRRDYAARKGDHRDKMDSFEGARKQIQSNHKLAQHEKEAALSGLKEPGDPPAVPTRHVSDFTVEAINKLFTEGILTLGLFSDEAASVLGGWSMAPEHRLRFVSMLSKLWDGDCFPIVRGGTETRIISGRRVCLNWSMQPVVAARFFNDPELQGQGFPARVLVCWTRTMAGTRLYRAGKLSDSAEYLKYCQRIHELLSAPMPVTDDELNPQAMQLSEDAKALWIRFYNAIEAQLHPCGSLAAIRAFGSKAAEHTLRLAAVLQAVEGGSEIGGDAMRNAIRLTGFYLRQWQRLFDDGKQNQAVSLLKWLRKWLSDKNKMTVSLRDIERYGPNPVRTKEAAVAALNTLMDHKLVRQSGNLYEVRCDGII